MAQDPNMAPMNQLPPVVWILSLPIIAMELVLSAGERGIAGGPTAIGWRTAAIEDYGFVNALFDRMVATGDVTGPALLRMVSYAFINLSFTSTVFVIVFLLALGNMVGRVFSGVAVVVIFLASAFVGALAYGLLLNDAHVLIGGFPAVYGLIGAYTFVLWVNAAHLGESQYRAFTLIGFLLGIQLVFRLLFGGSNDWVADIAGFVTGFALSFVLVPGGWSRLRDRLRHR